MYKIVAVPINGYLIWIYIFKYGVIDIKNNNNLVNACVFKDMIL